MKIVFLTSIFLTLGVVHTGKVFFSGNNMTSNLASPRNKKGPCQNSSDNKAYSKFAKNHILKDEFDKNSKDAWKSYLEDNKLCGRNEVQSFIEAQNENNVKQICSKSGRRSDDIENTSNLCISQNAMKVYNVKSTNNAGCTVTHVDSLSQHVIVACNKVGNSCLPVHYEKYNNQKPNNENCMPSA